MKVLWIAPWFRSLAHIYGCGLAREGHEVQVITSNKHPDPAPPAVEELVCPKSPYDLRWNEAFVAAERLYRAFRPEIVIADDMTDPMFAVLSRRMGAQWVSIHDASPHDESFKLHGMRKFVQTQGRRRAKWILTFSRHVAREVETARWITPCANVHHVKLLSDVHDEDVPAFRHERLNFVLMGHLRPYKNIDHVLRAWVKHVDGPYYRGDRLIMWGAGLPRTRELAAHRALGHPSVEWRCGGYRYSDIRAGCLSGFKGNLCVYSEASQSGAQVLSSQLGVAPIVSNVGALPEYQPSGLPMLDPTDLRGLVGVLDRLADPIIAAKLGRIAQARYIATNAGGNVTKELATLLAQTVARHS